MTSPIDRDLPKALDDALFEAGMEGLNVRHITMNPSSYADIRYLGARDALSLTGTAGEVRRMYECYRGVPIVVAPEEDHPQPFTLTCYSAADGENPVLVQRG